MAMKGTCHTLRGFLSSLIRCSCLLKQGQHKQQLQSIDLFI